MKYLVKDLEKILNAKKVNITNDTEITGIAIDSRKVKQGDLFIPFLGENVDGHNYIESAFEKGEIRHALHSFFIPLQRLFNWKFETIYKQKTLWQTKLNSSMHRCFKLERMILSIVF